MASENAKSAPLDFEGLVEGIRRNDQEAVEQLYTCFQKGLRWYMARRRVPDGEDQAHDVILATITAIQRDELRDPNRLAGFVRGVARNKACEAIGEIVKTRALDRTQPGHPAFDYDLLDYYQERPMDDRHFSASRLPNGEQRLLDRERTQAMVRALSTMGAKEREILDRFYLQEQTVEQICSEMNLSENQYRLLKSRAKTHLATLVRRDSGRAQVVADFRRARRATCA